MKLTAGSSVLLVSFGLLLAAVTWADEKTESKDIAYFPGCDTIFKTAPRRENDRVEWEYCLWPQEKVSRHEQEIIDKASVEVRRVILPHLKNAEWVYPEVLDERDEELNKKAIQENRSICSANLAALRSGKFTLFPQPDIKSSAVGYKALAQEWNQHSGQMGCIDHHYDTCRPPGPGSSCSAPMPGNTLARFYGNPKNMKQQVSWMYKTPAGRVLLFMVIPFYYPEDTTAPPFYMIADMEVGGRCESKRISPSNRVTENGEVEAFSYAEQAYGMIEIDGTLFSIMGGVLGMSDNDQVWSRSGLNPLRLMYYDFTKPEWRPIKTSETAKETMEQATGKKYARVESSRLTFHHKLSPSQQEIYDRSDIWPARVLELYPLRPGGKGNYAHCMWNIHE